MIEKSFKAGAAQVKITPPLGTRINGDFVAHYATHIHDDLYSKTLVLQRSWETIVIIVVDICSMSCEFIESVKKEITTKTNIPDKNIMISSTHTHASGSIEDVHMGGPDLAFRRTLPEKIVLSVEQAIDKLQPAKITNGKVSVPDHVLCRRYQMKPEYRPINPVNGLIDSIKTNPIGLEKYIDHPISNPDPEVSFIGVKSTDEEWISVLGNYSLHYVGDWPNGTISSDYFGVFARNIKSLLKANSDFVGIMTNGTSGDINIWDFQQPERYPTEYFAKSELIGKDIADTVFRSFSGSRWNEFPEISARIKPLPIHIRKPGIDEIIRASEIIMASDYDSYEYNDDNLRKIYAREQILLNEFPNSREAKIQAFKIGDLTLGALPGEFFAETGLKLKNEIGDHYFTIGLANGNIGYVPPAEEMKKGGYETWRCRYSCISSEAEYLFRKELIDLVKGFDI